jgi:hypothetical protein
VSIVDGDGARDLLYASDEAAAVIERLQLTLGEGPCVDASSTGIPVLVADLSDPRDVVAHRWAVSRNEAMRTGARAIFAFPIRIGAIWLAGVEFWRRTPGPLTRTELTERSLARSTRWDWPCWRPPTATATLRAPPPPT